MQVLSSELQNFEEQLFYRTSLGVVPETAREASDDNNLIMNNNLRYQQQQQ